MHLKWDFGMNKKIYSKADDYSAKNSFVGWKVFIDWAESGFKYFNICGPLLKGWNSIPSNIICYQVGLVAVLGSIYLRPATVLRPKGRNNQNTCTEMKTAVLSSPDCLYFLDLPWGRRGSSHFISEAQWQCLTFFSCHLLPGYPRGHV